jgi:hypothetical protein
MILIVIALRTSQASHRDPLQEAYSAHSCTMKMEAAGSIKIVYLFFKLHSVKFKTIILT